MPAEPSAQALLFDVSPRRPSPSARMIEEYTEPGSKAKDPPPSFLAAESLKASGAWHRQLWTVYHGVRRFPGLTAAELTKKLDLEDRYICNRRLPELRDRFSVVCNGRARACTVSRRRRLSQTWYCSRRFFSNGVPVAQDRVSAPKGTGPAGPSRAPAERREPEPILTPEQRRQMLRARAESGDAGAAAILETLTRRGK